MKIIFTTTNKYKIRSAESILNKYGVEVVGKEMGVDEHPDFFQSVIPNNNEERGGVDFFVS